MSSTELSLGELIKELQDIYHKILDMLTTAYTYSPTSLISMLDSWVKSREEWASLDEGEKSQFLISYNRCTGILDFYRNRVLPVTVQALDSLISIESKVTPSEIENIVRLLTDPLNEFTRDIINGWIVETARKCRTVKARFFDNYITICLKKTCLKGEK